MKSMRALILGAFAVCAVWRLSAQTVTNGSITGSPAANSGITAGYAPGWTTFAFSPDLCNVTFPSYSGNSQVPRIASPDGGTWLGIASLGEAAQTTITGLTIGQTYTLRWCGANFGTAALYNGTPANPQIIIVGVTSTTLSIPQVANTWNPYSLTFTATATSHILRCLISGGSTYASLDGFNLTGALCNPIILPVHFTSFTGQFDNCKVHLSWESPESENPSAFEVQRSTDGELFETLEKLDANSQRQGKWADIFPVEEAFYRIRMYNETGRVAESPVVRVAGTCAGAQAILFGNPVVEGKYAILRFTASGTQGEITLTDMEGRRIAEFQPPTRPGEWNEISIPVEGLRKGIYLIRTQDGAEVKLALQ